MYAYCSILNSGYSQNDPNILSLFQAYKYWQVHQYCPFYQYYIWMFCHLPNYYEVIEKHVWKECINNTLYILIKSSLSSLGVSMNIIIQLFYVVAVQKEILEFYLYIRK